MNAKPTVGAVIVAFRPDEERILRLAGVLAQQVDRVLLVDNTPGGSGLARATLPAGVTLLPLGENLGIAAGFNAGIEALRPQAPDYVFLSDQDSEPAADIVAQLLAAHRQLADAGRKVAVTGAIFVDPRDGHVEGFPVQGWRRLRFRTEPDGSGYVPASLLISSGSLIPWSVLDDVGLMNAGLFIDLVDVEWCYRAAALGYAVYGVPAARMVHTIGDDFIEYSFPFGKLRRRSLHSPFRIYFQLRNIFLLCWMQHVPLHWKFWNLMSIPEKAFIYLVKVGSKKAEYRRQFTSGILHGLRGKAGLDGRQDLEGTCLREKGGGHEKTGLPAKGGLHE